MSTVALGEMPVGSTFQIQARIDAVGTTGESLTLLGGEGDATQEIGVLHISPSGVITGQVQVALGTAQVQPVAFSVALSDVLANALSGEHAVVQWIGDDGGSWSSSVSGLPAYSTVGWVKVGTASFT